MTNHYNPGGILMKPLYLTLALLTTLLVTLSSPSAPAQAEVTQPNVVVITADDMRADDIRHMPYTRDLLGQLNLTEFVSNHPLCCPSRAEFLTGQFAQNSGVHHNGGPYGAYQSLQDKDNTLPKWLHDVGYRTGMTGKFMNGWRGNENNSQVPAGWDHFDTLTGEGRAEYTSYQYEVYNGPGLPNTPAVRFEHTNDFVTRQTNTRLTQLAGEQPFFWWSSYLAPHGMLNEPNGHWVGAQGAARHAGDYAGKVPTYIEKKPSFVPYSGSRDQWRRRVESLKSVDEGVRDIVQTLKDLGEFEDTVIIFTSDNGFTLGEHRSHTKNLPWEESLKVPLLATGPGVDTGISRKQAMVVDLAPSIAALAGATPGRTQDGRPDLFSTGGGWPDLLIQGGSDTNHFKWRGTRTPRWVYVHWLSGKKELYDLANDPYQMRNLRGKRPAVESRLARQTPNPY